jgi:LPXTG-site transpeptidase (sortase) family protein
MRRGNPALSFIVGFATLIAVAIAVVLVLPQRARTATTAAGAAGATTAAPTANAPTASPTPSGPQQFPLLSGAVPSLPSPGHPDRIVIQSIGLDAKVVDVGETMQNGKAVWDTAAFSVGFYRTTAVPGQRGNAVLAGHISSPVSHKGDIFRHLPEVRVGDEVDIYLAPDTPGERETEVRYVISQTKVVQPTETSVMGPTADPTLTLLTCYPDNVYTQRLVVVGKLLPPST